ncbi:MAG: ABC transporter substrate-binding protein [Rhodospirillaceae bacterium]|nr:ABC transporter substrate-binding protein [Rhodospirillaceae bacterium]
MTHRPLITALLAFLFALPAQADDVLKIGNLALPEGRGVPHTAIGTPYFMIWPAVFDGLTVIGPDGEAKPMLAESWQPLNPTTWHFKLKPNLFFSNGEPVDATAVVETFKTLATPEGLRWSVNNAYRGITGARAIDALTVEVTTDPPDRLLPRRIGAIRILPPKYWAQVGSEGFAKAPIGSGPYTVDSWTGARIRMTANPTSWRKPKIPKLDVRELTEGTARLQALLSGAIDIALYLNPEDKAEVENAGGSVVTRSGGSVEVLSFITVKKSPLQDKRVRQALNYAVDKQAIVDGLLGGVAVAASQPAPKGAFGRDEALKPYPYDPARAKALLAEAGYEKGFSFTVEASSGGRGPTGSIAQKIAQDLAAVGVTMEIRSVPQSKIFRGAYDGSFEGEAFSMMYGSIPYMDALASLRLHSCLWQTPWNCTPAFAERITKAYAAFDMAEREKLTRDLVRDIRDDAPALWLYEDVTMDGVAARVKNYRPVFSHIAYEDLELAK